MRSKYLDTYQGLCQLEHQVNHEAVIVAPREKQGPNKRGYVKRSEREEWDLKEVHEQLLKERKEKEAPRARKEPALLRAVEKPAPRPKTPTIADHPAEHVAKQNAAITLQRLMRGMASRARTLNELRRRLDLVNEIRSTHILLESERMDKEAEKMTVMDARLAAKNKRQELARVAEVAQGVAGAVARASGAELGPWLGRGG